MLIIPVKHIFLFNLLRTTGPDWLISWNVNLLSQLWYGFENYPIQTFKWNHFVTPSLICSREYSFWPISNLVLMRLNFEEFAQKTHSSCLFLSYHNHKLYHYCHHCWKYNMYFILFSYLYINLQQKSFCNYLPRLRVV